MSDVDSDPLRQEYRRRNQRSQELAGRLMGDVTGPPLTTEQREVLQAYAAKRITTRQLVESLGPLLNTDSSD